MNAARAPFSLIVPLGCITLLAVSAEQGTETGPKSTLDPAAWGADHVGKPVPEYITGDECLFCHRAKVGPTWGDNRHQSTVRLAGSEPDALAVLRNSEAHQPFAALAEFVIGRTNQLRILKRSSAYGKLDLLSSRMNVRDGLEIVDPADDGPIRWDHDQFASRCAGCHTTAVDSVSKTFSAISLDCYSCHGDVDLDHTNNPEKVLLAKKRNDPARLVVSLCGSCHIRSGHSRSTGLPYPNNFVPGDNLFRDFKVDFSDGALSTENAIDRHILENIRDVAIHGEENMTCLSCHNVHRGSSLRHRRLKTMEYCWTCHDGDTRKILPGWSDVHSQLCEY